MTHFSTLFLFFPLSFSPKVLFKERTNAANISLYFDKRSYQNEPKSYRFYTSSTYFVHYIHPVLYFLSNFAKDFQTTHVLKSSQRLFHVF